MIVQYLKCCALATRTSCQKLLWSAAINMLPLAVLVTIFAAGGRYQLSQWICFGALLFAYHFLCPHPALMSLKSKISSAGDYHLHLRPGSVYLKSLYYWLGHNIELFATAVLMFIGVFAAQLFISGPSLKLFFGFYILLAGAVLRFSMCYLIMVQAKTMRGLNIYFNIEGLIAGVYGALLPLAIAPQFIQKTSIFVPSAYVFGYGSWLIAFNEAPHQFIRPAAIGLFWLVMFSGWAALKNSWVGLKGGIVT
jgi:ABC-type uncharacterized transport system permease subunit